MSGVIQSEYSVPRVRSMHVLEELKRSTGIDSVRGAVGDGDFLVVFDHPTKVHHAPRLCFCSVSSGEETRELHLLWIRGAEDFAMRVETAVQQCGGEVTFGAVGTGNRPS